MLLIQGVYLLKNVTNVIIYFAFFNCEKINKGEIVLRGLNHFSCKKKRGAKESGFTSRWSFGCPEGIKYLFGESFLGGWRLARGNSQVKPNERAAGGTGNSISIPSLSERLIYVIRLVQIIEKFIILEDFQRKETVLLKGELIFASSTRGSILSDSTETRTIRNSFNRGFKI